MAERPFVIGISGPSGSGKTWLAKDIEADLNATVHHINFRDSLNPEEDPGSRIRLWQERVEAVADPKAMVVVDDVQTVEEARAIEDFCGIYGYYLVYLDDQSLSDEQVGAELLQVKEIATPFRVNRDEWLWAYGREVSRAIFEALCPFPDMC